MSAERTNELLKIATDAINELIEIEFKKPGLEKFKRMERLADMALHLNSTFAVRVADVDGANVLAAVDGGNEPGRFRDLALGELARPERAAFGQPVLLGGGVPGIRGDQPDMVSLIRDMLMTVQNNNQVKAEIDREADAVRLRTELTTECLNLADLRDKLDGQEKIHVEALLKTKLDSLWKETP